MAGICAPLIPNLRLADEERTKMILLLGFGGNDTYVGEAKYNHLSVLAVGC